MIAHSHYQKHEDGGPCLNEEAKSVEKFPGLFMANKSAPAKTGKKDPFAGLFLKPEVEERLAKIRTKKEFGFPNFVDAKILRRHLAEVI